MSILDDAEKALAKAKKMADQAGVVINKKKAVDTLKRRRKGVEKGKGQIQDYTDDARKIGFHSPAWRLCKPGFPALSSGHR